MSKDKDVKLSAVQLGFMLAGFLYGSTAIVNPAIGAGRDSWLAVIVGSILGISLLLIYVNIAMLNPGKTLVEILRSNFGYAIGTIVSVLYIWYFTHLASLVMRNFGEFMSTVSYPETPIAVIIFLFALIVTYSVKRGLEIIGRVCEILIPIVPIIILATLFALMTTHNLSAFKPFLEKGISPVITAGFGLSTFPYGEAVAFLMIFPYLNEKNLTKKTTIIATLIIMLLFLVVVMRDTMIYNQELIKIISYVPDITARLIPGISIEPFVDVNLLIGGGTKVAVCLYAAAKGMADVLKSKDYKPFATALASFAAVMSIWIYEDSLEMTRWATEVWPYYSIPFQYVIPILLLLISWLKNRKKTKVA